MSLGFTHNLLPDTQIGIAAVLGCVGITEVRGRENIDERANAQNLRQFHLSPLPRYMHASQNVGAVKFFF